MYKAKSNTSIDWNQRMINKKKCEENQIINNARKHIRFPLFCANSYTGSSPFYIRKWNTNWNEERESTNQPNSTTNQIAASSNINSNQRQKRKRRRKKYNICCDIIGHNKYANTVRNGLDWFGLVWFGLALSIECPSKVRENSGEAQKRPFSIHLFIFILFVDANGNENKLSKNDMCTGNRQIMRSDRAQIKEGKIYAHTERESQCMRAYVSALNE